MNRQLVNIGIWLILLAFTLGFIILTRALLESPNVTPESIIGWITGGLLPLLTIIYSQAQKRSMRLFLFTQRLRTFFSSQTLNWSLAANFSDEHLNPTILDDLAKQLMTLNTNQVEVTVKRINQFNHLVTIVPGPTLDILFIPQQNRYGDAPIKMSDPSIYVTINNYRVGHRQVARVLRNEIAPVLETVANTIHATDASYNFTIEFDKSRNPFFSLYIKNLPLNVVSQFLIQLNIPQHGHNNRIVVSESKVAINTGSQHTLRELALQFLAFDSDLGEHLQHV